MRAWLNGRGDDPRGDARCVLANNASIVLLVVLLALAQWHLVEQALGTGYADSMREAKRVFLGTPTWRVYQSRVLGPYTVQGLSYLVGDYASAYWLFNTFCLAVAGYLAYFTGALVNRRTGGIVGLLLFQCLFALCLDRRWLYVWDPIDIIIFYVFFIVVIRATSCRWTVLLFAIALFNRESALFIALWLMADPLSRWGLGRLGYAPAQPLDRQSILAGAVCMALGILTIAALRTALLVEELGIKGGMPGIYGAHVFHTFQHNLRQVVGALTFADPQLSITVPAFITILLVFICRLAIARPAVFLGAAVIYFAQFAAVMIFGLAFETRIYLDFIPFMTVAAVALMKPEPATDASDRTGTLVP